MPKTSAYVATADEAAGVDKIFHRHHDGDWTYEAAQDCQPIADANAEARNHCNPWNRTRDWKQVARIPAIWALKWQNELGIDIFNPDDDERVNRLLDDPDNRWMRTDESRLSRGTPSKRQIEERLRARSLIEGA